MCGYVLNASLHLNVLFVVVQCNVKRYWYFIYVYEFVNMLHITLLHIKENFIAGKKKLAR